ncbi:hypothetical protein AYI69_g7794 [Smittium culicis]|uniref:Uncharacterized protein n=1 Tax=Smittium culicis TaxID=133412 RepID=A0A1R1XCD9_9FUNG|nr:hypothetical protein AYI69_g9460 [Smittium culicis]OMJ16558.1 hypothetical protein AYI69_g7794 [Smittium culicis]
MGENKKRQNIDIPGRNSNDLEVEGGTREKYGPNIFQANWSGIQNQVRKVVDDAITVDKPSWYGYKFPELEPQCSFLQGPGPSTRSGETIYSWPDDVEIPCEFYWERPRHVGVPNIGAPNVESTFGTQEQLVVINEDMDIDRDTERAHQA